MTVSFQNAQEAKDFALDMAKIGGISSNKILSTFATKCGLSTAKQYLEMLDSKYNKPVRIYYNEGNLSFDTGVAPLALSSHIHDSESIPLGRLTDGDKASAKEELMQYNGWSGHEFYSSLCAIVINSFNEIGVKDLRDGINEAWDALAEDSTELMDHENHLAVAEICSQPYMPMLMSCMRSHYLWAQSRVLSDAGDEFDADWLSLQVNKETVADMAYDLFQSVFLGLPIALADENDDTIKSTINNTLNDDDFKATFLFNLLLPKGDQNLYS
jgi:hypothetical protein